MNAVWPIALVIVSSGILPAEEPRVVETVLPALTFGAGCSSGVELRNLGEREVSVIVEAHRAAGPLVEFENAPGNRFVLQSGQELSLRPRIEEETAEAWVAVRERVAPAERPVLAITASTECIRASGVSAVIREAAYPMRNPWFSAEIGEVSPESLLVLNTSDRPATVAPCYSSGNLFSLPGQSLRRVCSAAEKIQIPPFGSRTFPLRQDANSRFDLRTTGAGIVLQALRPLAGNSRVFVVDSSVSFGSQP